LTKKLVNALLSEEIRAGIRPMDISITSEKRDEYSVPVKIHIIEPLGRFAIVTAGVNQMLFKIKVRGYLNIKEDQLVWLNFDENKLHFFDCNNSLALKLEQ
jgi:ABC-type sugar transport system ATPase subunit